MLAFCAAQAQGLRQPAPGNAMVYLVRPSTFGLAIGFRYFSGEEFIGKSLGKQYVSYECLAGEQLFWAMGGGGRFAYVKADLAAGSSYIIAVYPKAGSMTSSPRMYVADAQELRLQRKCMRLISKKLPRVLPTDALHTEQAKWATEIGKAMEEFRLAKRLTIDHLGPEDSVALANFR